MCRHSVTVSRRENFREKVVTHQDHLRSQESSPLWDNSRMRESLICHWAVQVMQGDEDMAPPYRHSGSSKEKSTEIRDYRTHPDTIITTPTKCVLPGCATSLNSPTTHPDEQAQHPCHS